MARIEAGTLLLVGAGTRLQVVGDRTLSESVLSTPVFATLVNAESLPYEVSDTVTLRAGAYARLLEPAQSDNGTIPSGTVVFLVPGSNVGVAQKAVPVPEAACPCSSSVLGYLVVFGLGALVAWLLR